MLNLFHWDALLFKLLLNTLLEEVFETNTISFKLPGARIQIINFQNYITVLIYTGFSIFAMLSFEVNLRIHYVMLEQNEEFKCWAEIKRWP